MKQKSGLCSGQLFLLYTVAIFKIIFLNVYPSSSKLCYASQQCKKGCVKLHSAAALGSRCIISQTVIFSHRNITINRVDVCPWRRNLIHWTHCQRDSDRACLCHHHSSSSPSCSQRDNKCTNNSCKCDISIHFMQYSLFLTVKVSISGSS